MSISSGDIAVVAEVRRLTKLCLESIERGDTAKAEEYRRAALTKALPLRQKWTGVLEA